MTESEWLRIAAWISRIWPHQPVEPDSAVAWLPFLADLDAAAVRTAVGQLALDPEQRFAPSIGQIRAACDPTGRDWLEAWQDVVDACSGSGRVRYDGDDRHVGQFVETLGPWTDDVDTNSFALRAQFRDWYRQAQTDTHAEAHRAIAARVTGDGVPELEAVKF